jgi:hypothetical protein
MPPLGNAVRRCDAAAVTAVTIAPTGVLRIDGSDVFPIGFSNPPPLGRQAPSGKEGLEELKARRRRKAPAVTPVAYIATDVADPMP